jgi:uncharacterized protein (TIGR02391 family)
MGNVGQRNKPNGSRTVQFRCEQFLTDGITSQRAQLIYCWLMSLARQPMELDQRNQLLVTFCQSIAPADVLDDVLRALSNNGVPLHAVYAEGFKEFYAREFHSEVVKHSRRYFLERNYFHSVFEACKAYNRAVQVKSQSNEDGQSLMLGVWGVKGVLKITPCQTETDENVQEGVKFMSAGVMRAARNPPAHETALDWPVKKEDCLDILSLLSFLFRQLDKAIFVAKA